jgi:hypothetical protein
VAQNQPTEAQKETPTLKLPNMEIHSLKNINSIRTSGKVPDDGRTGQRIKYIFEKYKVCSKKYRTFAINTILLILQHFKHRSLQSSPLYWRHIITAFQLYSRICH